MKIYETLTFSYNSSHFTSAFLPGTSVAATAAASKALLLTEFRDLRILRHEAKLTGARGRLMLILRGNKIQWRDSRFGKTEVLFFCLLQRRGCQVKKTKR